MNMKQLVFLLMLPLCSMTGFAAAQWVSVEYWWMEGDDKLTDIDDRVGDPKLYQLSGGTCTFTAFPHAGEKAVRWMRYTGSPTEDRTIDKYETVQENGTPFTWQYSGSETVRLALVCDWIRYQLVYEGMSSTNLIYTNKFTIADCTLNRKGYHFAGAWTNEVGTSYEAKSQRAGSDFALTNNDDSAVVTLYPKWEANTAGLTYELDGGSHGSSHPETMTYDQPFEVSDPMRIGYGLKEWTIDPKPSDSRVERLAGSTRFMNLFESDKADVTLAAVWTACTYKVTFNNHGATTGPDRALVMTYGSKYEAVNLPLKAGNAFLGYFTEESGGEKLWDDEGQPSRAVWDLPSDTTAHARWQAATFHIAYNANGGQGSINDLLVTNGVKTVLSKGEGLSFPGCTFLGWATSATAGMPDYLPGAEITLTRTENLTLYAVWKMPYFIAYDGHGKTSGEMPVQECVRGEEAFFLPNEFAKRGYAFAGWAKTAVGADQLKVDFADRQIIKDMGDVPGATNTVFAVWTTNTYYVAFDKGEGTGEPMEAMKFFYDQTQRLARCTFTAPSELHVFAGWRNAIDGSLIKDEAIVSNLCAVANGTNTLAATWKLDVGEWSDHMHCTTLRWGVREGTTPWELKEGKEWGVIPGMSVIQDGAGMHPAKSWLTAVVTTNGTLSFSCRWNRASGSTKPDSWLAVGFADDDSLFHADGLYGKWPTNTILLSTPSQWQRVELPVKLASGKSQVQIHIENFIGEPGDSIEIDQMVWIPEGTDPGGDEPQPGKDEPTVTGIAFENGKVVIRSTGDAKFGYQVLSTLSLTPANWQPESESYQAGQTDGQTFELTIDPAEPQKFYKVEVLKKR